MYQAKWTIDTGLSWIDHGINQHIHVLKNIALLAKWTIHFEALAEDTHKLSFDMLPATSVPKTNKTKYILMI